MNRAALQTFLGRAQAELENLFPATIKLGIDAAALASFTAVAAATGGTKRGSAQFSGMTLAEDEIGFRVRTALLGGFTVDNLVGLRLLWVEKSLTFRVHQVATGSPSDAVWHIVCRQLHS